jgi:hypothetical protein
VAALALVVKYKASIIWTASSALAVIIDCVG